MTEELPLGKATAYPEQYSPGLLYAIARSDSRSTLGLTGALPFHGCDIWNAWELTWLNPDGLPQVVTAEIRVPADSPNIIESKSLKLYLNSFAMTVYASSNDVAETIEQDLIGCTNSEVSVQLTSPSATEGAGAAKLPGDSLDSAGVRCDVYAVDAGLLQADSGDIVTEQLHSHLLRSLCPVTSQSDSGSVMISYRGARIDRAGLLRYIVSFRRHNDYHESCVERMFTDILEHCKPEQLSVYARYQRRGGIDINPFRSNFEHDPPNARAWRQ